MTSSVQIVNLKRNTSGRNICPPSFVAIVLISLIEVVGGGAEGERGGAKLNNNQTVSL